MPLPVLGEAHPEGAVPVSTDSPGWAQPIPRGRNPSTPCSSSVSPAEFCCASSCPAAFHPLPILALFFPTSPHPRTRSVPVSPHRAPAGASHARSRLQERLLLLLFPLPPSLPQQQQQQQPGVFRAGQQPGDPRAPAVGRETHPMPGRCCRWSPCSARGGRGRAAPRGGARALEGFPGASRHGTVPFPSGKDNGGASLPPPAAPSDAAACAARPCRGVSVPGNSLGSLSPLGRGSLGWPGRDPGKASGEGFSTNLILLTRDLPPQKCGSSQGGAGGP